tara:strand:+ start:51 stop:338 length:288 start_codon:yes stop_codon:yes gene_type:complete
MRKSKGMKRMAKGGMKMMKAKGGKFTTAKGGSKPMKAMGGRMASKGGSKMMGAMKGKMASKGYAKGGMRKMKGGGMNIVNLRAEAKKKGMKLVKI